MNRLRRLGICLAPLAALIALSATAFACTSLATLSLSSTTVPAGSRVAVTGKALESAPVELRWNGADGPLLATAQGPEFTAMVTVPPDATAGTHYIQAVQQGRLGTHRVPVALEVPSVGGAPGVRAPETANQGSWLSGTPLVAGLVLLSAGVAAAGVGFGAVELRRRRVTVASGAAAGRRDER